MLEEKLYHIYSVLVQGAVMNAFMVSLLVGFASYITANSYVRVCHHTNWSQYRPGAGKFFPENIEPDLCTHLIYTFAKIDCNTDKLAMFEWNDDKLYPRFNALKLKNPGLRTLLTVGGWNHKNTNSPRWSKLRLLDRYGNFKPFVLKCF